MSNIALKQIDLNESLRGLTSVDIVMFSPDKSVAFPSNAVSLNKKALKYTSNFQSLLEFSTLPQANLATFENNLWILDGSFISPSESYSGGGDSYVGYMSEDMTDDNGNYETNPILSIMLSAPVPNMHYISVQFAGGVATSYPKSLIIRTYDPDDTLIDSHTYITSEQTGLPLLTARVDDDNVKRVELELIGTVCPHRRSRLQKVMFGKAERVDKNYLQSWDIDDKASLVADSIPSKKLTYNVINYRGDYNIDNPGNKIPINYKEVLIFFTFGMEQNGLWKYAPTKTFNLIEVSTTPEGIVTFECGSLLDILTETYDNDVYTGAKTISQIMSNLLSFSGKATDECILNEFADYRINIPIPEQPVRELIQRLAFSCGATLTVNNDNKIVFSKKNIIPNANTPKFMYHKPNPFNSAGVLLAEPSAEALSNTTNIAMYTYNTRADNELSQVGTVDIATINPTRISYPAVSGSITVNNQELDDQSASVASIENVRSQHAILTLNWTSSATPPIKVTIYGRKTETTKTTPKTSDMNTLLLDSGLALTVPSNLIKPANPDPNTFYYTDWYGAKFKYKCKTRKEFLVNAGDIIYFETPFSNGQPNRVGYVLRNSYSNDGDSGEMEVITIGNS